MPADSLSLTSMTFVRQSFARNFYNSSKVMSSINMDGARLFLPDAADVVLMGGDSTEAVTMRQEGRTLLLGTPADRRGPHCVSERSIPTCAMRLGSAVWTTVRQPG